MIRESNEKIFVKGREWIFDTLKIVVEMCILFIIVHIKAMFNMILHHRYYIVINSNNGAD